MEFTPRFLTSPPGAVAAHENYMPGADLAFLPEASAEEKAYLLHVGRDPLHGIAVVHSAAGLLLCSRGHTRSVHYYICNPMTWQWVALPELPLPVCDQQCGLLTVATGEEDAAAAKGFQVVLVNNPGDWLKPGGQLDLRVFTSDTGQWETRQLPGRLIPSASEDYLYLPPILAQSGNSYWMSYSKDQAIAYNNAAGGGGATGSIRVIALPDGLVHGRWNRCIGERQGGGLRYVQSDLWVLEVWHSSSSQDQSGRDWTLVHRISVELLMERNPGAAAFLRDKNPSHWSYHHGKPVGIHPADDDVIFVSLPGAVFAYSIEHGTMNLQCTTHDYIVSQLQLTHSRMGTHLSQYRFQQ